jgi:hypothetical protein
MQIAPSDQDQNRNPSNSIERFNNGDFRNIQSSNFKAYTNIEPSSKKNTK